MCWVWRVFFLKQSESVILYWFPSINDICRELRLLLIISCIFVENKGFHRVSTTHIKAVFFCWDLVSAFVLYSICKKKLSFQQRFVCSSAKKNVALIIITTLFSFATWTTRKKKSVVECFAYTHKECFRETFFV